MMPQLRYKYCPMCGARLDQDLTNDVDAAETRCPACTWIGHPPHVVAASVIVRVGDDLVAILPPDEPIDTPAALPTGSVAHAESPFEAAVRVALEATGLVVEAVSCMGWYFGPRDVFPGPGVTFMFETRALGGTLRDSAEGRTRVFSLRDFPLISPNRAASARTMRAFLARLSNQ
jgi:ADP-ribose pyrophosphatase YjhB (NUDIX family)